GAWEQCWGGKTDGGLKEGGHDNARIAAVDSAEPADQGYAEESDAGEKHYPESGEDERQPAAAQRDGHGRLLVLARHAGQPTERSVSASTTVTRRRRWRRRPATPARSPR